MSSHKSNNDAIYERGVHAGQQAGVLERVVHPLVMDIRFPYNARENESYNSGFAYGLAHPRQRPAIPASAPIVASETELQVPVSGRAGDSASLPDMGDDNPIMVVCAVIGVIWGSVAGFQAGGLWGAFWGAIFGMLAGYLAGIAVMLAIGAAILFGFFWVVWQVVRFLWNLS